MTKSNFSSRNIKRYIKEKTPKSILPYVLKGWRAYWGVREAVLRSVVLKLDEWKIISPDSIYSENYYKKRKDNSWRKDAKQISDRLYNEFEPDNVVDFGCGVGLYLKYFKESGCQVFGVDGSEAAIENAVVEESEITKYDLRDYYETGQKYDLAICFEVLEHIPEKFDNNLVRTLTNAGEILVITAASPGQGGKHHVNEKPREYWIDKFENFGFQYSEKHTEILKKDINADKLDWISKNLMVFMPEEEA